MSVLGGYAKADNSYWIVMTNFGYEFMIKFKPASETFSSDRYITESTKLIKRRRIFGDDTTYVQWGSYTDGAVSPNVNYIVFMFFNTDDT